MTMGTVPATSRPFWITGGDADVVFPQDARDLGQDPGPVQGRKPEVVVGHQVVHGFDKPPGVERRFPPQGRHPARDPVGPIAGQVDEVLTTALAVGIIPAP